MARMNFDEYPDFPHMSNEEDEEISFRYSRRREMQEIIPGLFLGPYSVAGKNKLNHLQQYGISHIVCIRHSLEVKIIKPNFPDHMQYLVIEAADVTTQNILKFCNEVKVFIDRCFQNGGRVLVHGNVGFSRSAALVIAYLMETYEIPFDTAYQYVRERRPCICPNVGFRDQLKELEPIIKAKSITFDRGKARGPNFYGTKRKFEEESAMDTE